MTKPTVTEDQRFILMDALVRNKAVLDTLDDTAFGILKASYCELLRKRQKRTRAPVRREIRKGAAVPPGQLALVFDRQYPKRGAQNWLHRNRRTRRNCKYPYIMVLDARRMRANQYHYKEIAAALERDYGISVPWITVRDWTQQYCRILG